MDVSLINAFLSARDLTSVEEKLKNNVLGLNDLAKKLSAERDELNANLQKKQEEFLRVSGALENQLALVLDMAKEKGLKPLEPLPPPTEVVEEQAV